MEFIWKLKETNFNELVGSVGVIHCLLPESYRAVIVFLCNIAATVTFHVWMLLPVFVGTATSFIAIFN